MTRIEKAAPLAAHVGSVLAGRSICIELGTPRRPQRVVAAATGSTPGLAARFGNQSSQEGP